MRYGLLKRSAKPLALICTVLLLQACAAAGKQTETIEDRVNGRWAALLGNDIESAYAYLTPGYRSSVSLEQYKRAIASRKMKWTSAKYVKSDCDENNCTVQVDIGFTVYGVLPGVKSMNSSQFAEETWILVDKNWYMIPPQ
jgi:hypothetical protein